MASSCSAHAADNKELNFFASHKEENEFEGSAVPAVEWVAHWRVSYMAGVVFRNGISAKTIDLGLLENKFSDIDSCL